MNDASDRPRPIELNNEMSNFQLPELRVFPDDGHDWPLWGDFGQGRLLEPDDLGVSTALKQDLRDWYDYWAVNHASSGWIAESDPTAWRVRGQAISSKLQLELDGKAQVVNIVDDVVEGPWRKTQP